jgi:opacity protein-like surface antigen
MKRYLLVLVAASALAASHGAMAQYGRGGGAVGASAGDWEFRIGPVFTESKNVSFNGGSNANIDSTTGVKLGTGWYVTNQLAIGMNFAWAQTSFNGSVCAAQVGCNAANPPSIHIENGHVDFSTLNFDATYTFLDGPIKPLVVAGLGWQWLNTNIASAPPQTGCWWDPWWGYVCSTWQPTHGSSSFTYQVGGGVQFNFRRSFAINVDYRYTWFQLTNSTGTPAVGTVELMFVWRFPGSSYY